MSHILVTGANGFIGSHLVRHLLDLKKTQGWREEIVCLIRSSSDVSSLKGLDVKLVIGDVRNPETLVNAVGGATYIFHAAAELYVTTRRQFLEANTNGTKNLLEAAVVYAKDSLKRFLFVSSMAAAGPSSNDEPITEEDEPPRPVSWYAESKLEAEKIVMQYASTIPVTIVRPCAVYGERDSGFYQAFKGVELRIHALPGFRKRYTGMIYGKDLVEGIAAAARHPETIGQIYFLANPENYTVRKVMKTMAKAVGKTFGLTLHVPLFIFRIVAILSELSYLFIRKAPIPSRDKVRDLSQVYWLCTAQKAEQDFGWSAKTSLLDGLRATYEFIKNEERKLREMRKESQTVLWIKYFTLSFMIGVIIEALAAFGQVYLFDPWWLALIVVFVLWGFIFGSIAMIIRTRGFFIQYLPGFVILFGGEWLNSEFFHKWYFPEGTLLGDADTVVRAAILGIATGFLIPIINAIMIQFYKIKQ
jgi:nucleoside-diphosphate-sugar epimerase